MQNSDPGSVEELFRLALAAETEVRVFYKQFRTIRNLDDAYTIAHDLENSEVMTVFSFIRDKYVPLVHRHSFTLSVLEDHLGRIMDFPRRFGDESARRMVRVRRRNR